jgi:HSP20 family protein
VNKDSVGIRVQDSILTIKGKADYKVPTHILREEFKLHGYFRQFQLSDEVNQDKIWAESKNGVLTIMLPKAEKNKPRQIKVQLG